MRSRALALGLCLSAALLGCGDSDSLAEDWKAVKGVPEALAYGAVWSFGPDDVWVTADGGRVLHYDGAGWDETSLETNDMLLGIWGFAPDDVWMVGGDTLARYDGSDWTLTDFREESPGIEGLAAIWGSAPDDVWVVGTQSTAAHWDGSAWRRHIAAGTENGAVWGSGPDDVYVTGLFDIGHWDGSAWSDVETDLFSAEGVWGFGADDVWLADGSGELAHFDGSDWEAVELDFFGGPSALWGSASNDVWGAGSFGSITHYDGGAWREVTSQALGSPYLRVFNRIHGSSADDVWVVGSQSGDNGVTPLLWRYEP